MTRTILRGLLVSNYYSLQKCTVQQNVVAQTRTLSQRKSPLKSALIVFGSQQNALLFPTDNTTDRSSSWPSYSTLEHFWHIICLIRLFTQTIILRPSYTITFWLLCLPLYLKCSPKHHHHHHPSFGSSCAPVPWPCSFWERCIVQTSSQPRM